MSWIYWLEEEREKDKAAKCWGERRWSMIFIIRFPLMVILPIILCFVVVSLSIDIAMEAIAVATIGFIIAFLLIVLRKVFNPGGLISKDVDENKE